MNYQITEIEGMFEGPIRPLMIKLALPILVSQMVELFYTFVDTIFISMIDKTSTANISGIGLVFPIFLLFFAIAFGIGTGVSALIAGVLAKKIQSLLIGGQTLDF